MNAAADAIVKVGVQTRRSRRCRRIRLMLTMELFKCRRTQVCRRNFVGGGLRLVWEMNVDGLHAYDGVDECESHVFNIVQQIVLAYLLVMGAFEFYYKKLHSFVPVVASDTFS